MATQTSRTMVGIGSGVLACGLSISLIALQAVLANVSGLSSMIKDIALAGAVLEALVLLSTILVMLMYTRRSQSTTDEPRSRRLVYLAAYTTISFIAAAVALVATVRADHAHDAAPMATFLIPALYAVWAITMIAQILFLVAMLLRPKTHTPAPSDDVDQSFDSTTDPKASSSIEMTPSPPRVPPVAIVKPSPSPMLSRRASVRNSVQQILHPANSKTRLIRQTSFQTDQSSVNDRPPSPSTRQEDAFDTWEVDDDDDIVEAARSPTMRRLATIPQSRPVSPAKPLDGPFPEYEQEQNEKASAAAAAAEEEDADIPISSIENDEDHCTFLEDETPGSTMPPFAPRRRGSSITQSHIHPLFRTDSPEPPPVRSPGTIVTGSLWGGQVISNADQAVSLTRPSSSQTSRQRPITPGSRPASRSSSARPARMPLRSVQSDDHLVHGRLHLPDAANIRRQQSFRDEV